MALAMNGLHRIAGKLSIRYKRLAIAMAIAALAVLILSAAWIFYDAHIAPMRLEQVFALVTILVALAAGLAGFGLAEIVFLATLEKRVTERTQAFSSSSDQFKATIEELNAAKLQAETA